MSEPRRPDGIDADDDDPPRRLRRYASPLSLLLFGGVLLAAFLGVFGGQPSRPVLRESAAARVEVVTPRRIRNGEFYETRILIEARQPIADAVLAVTPALWKDMTVNTHIPAASEEFYRGSRYSFSYGPLAAGDTLEIKLDGQINPPLVGGTAGAIGLRDGERLLLDIPLSITVLP